MPHELVDTPQANYKTSLLDFGNCPVKRWTSGRLYYALYLARVYDTLRKSI